MLEPEVIVVSTSDSVELGLLVVDDFEDVVLLLVVEVSSSSVVVEVISSVVVAVAAMELLIFRSSIQTSHPLDPWNQVWNSLASAAELQLQVSPS